MDDDEMGERLPTADDFWEWANDGTLSASMRAQAWDNLAHLKFHDGEISEAATYHEMAEKYFLEAGWTEQAADAAYWQGRFHSMDDQDEKAIACFERAADGFRETGSETWLAGSIRGAAESFKALEMTDEAIVRFESAASFFTALEQWFYAGECHMEAAEIRGSCGHSADALAEFTQARDFFARAEYTTHGMRAADRMAAALTELGRHEEAIALLRENIDLARFVNKDELVAWSQYRLGWTLNVDGQFVEALQWLDLARRFYDENERFKVKSDIDFQRYNALRSLGEFEESELIGRSLRAYWKSVNAFEKLALHDANVALERVSTNPRAAVTQAEAAAAMAKEHCGEWTQRAVRLSLAEILVATGDSLAGEAALAGDLASQWHDNALYKMRHLMVLAASSKADGRPHESRGIVEQVIQIAEESQRPDVLGAAYAMLAQLADNERDADRAQDMRAKAVAHLLAAGDAVAARELATQLLPDSSERRRNEEWRIIGVDDHAPEIPREAPAPRERRVPTSREVADSRTAQRPDAPKSEGSTSGAPTSDAPDTDEHSPDQGDSSTDS